MAETGVFANFADVICKHSLLYIGSHVKTYALILLFTLSTTLTATATGIVGQNCVYGAQGNHPVTAAAKPDSSKSTSGEAIVRTAMQYLGVRYRAGHSGPKGFDCSGFTNYVYKKENISLTRSSRSQYGEGVPVTDKAALKKGDLVFFGGSRSSKSVGHVGVVTEVDPVSNNFKFIHASRTGIKVDDYSMPYYRNRYIGARRILESEK